MSWHWPHLFLRPGRRHPLVLIPVLSLAVLGPPAVGGDPPPAAASLPAGPEVTLPQLLEGCVTRNAGLRAAEARVGAAVGRAFQARRWPNPEIEVGADEIPVDRGNGLSDSQQLIGVSQVIPWPGKKPLDGRLGLSDVRLTEAAREQERRNLLQSVSVAFWEAIAAGQSATVARELVEIARSSAEAARRRVEAGAAAEQEVLRAEVVLEQALARQAGFERDQIAARESLVALLDDDSLRRASLAGALETLPASPPASSDLEDWISRHPILIAADAEQGRLRLAERRSRLEPYPDVRLSVAGGRDGAADASILEFRVSVPLPILDRSRGRRQESRANLNAAIADTARIRQGLRRDGETLIADFRNAIEQVTRYRDRILPKAGEALRLVQIGFEQGKFGLVDLLDTQRTLAESRLTYLARLLDLKIANARLLALQGSQTPPQTTPSSIPSNPFP